MKKLIILLILVSATVSSQESKDDYILGSENITGLATKDGLTFNYDCTVKYKFVLFGGVKMNVNITNMSIAPNTYNGKEITHSLLDSLNIKHNYGSIDVKRGLYDLKTNIKFFIPFTFKDAHIINEKIPSVGWGSIDEYTYLEDKDINRIRKKLNVIKPEDFYNLDVNLWNTEITDFNIDILRDIKNALDKKKDNERIIIEKLKELEKLKDNSKLSLDKLKHKKQLLKELIELEVKKCFYKENCTITIKKVDSEIKKRLGIKGMSKEEIIDHVTYLIESYQASWDKKIGIKVTPCEITYNSKYTFEGETFTLTHYIPLIEDKISCYISGSTTIECSYSKSRHKVMGSDNIPRTSRRKIIYLSDAKDQDLKKVEEALKHLASFCPQ